MLLKEYLPDWLKDFLEIQQIMDSEQVEFDNFGNALDNVIANMFKVTMNEYGCYRWETILGLAHDTALTLEERRNIILTTYIAQMPFTYKRVLEILKSISPNANLIVDNQTFEAYVTATVVGLSQRDAIASVLFSIMPANIRTYLTIYVKQKHELIPPYFVGFTTSYVEHVHHAV